MFVAKWDKVKVNARVSIAADPGCRILHLGWDSPDATTSANRIYYQAFDIVTRKFIDARAEARRGAA